MPSIPTEPAYPALVIDGSSSSFFAGVLNRESSWQGAKVADAPALESLFQTVGEVLCEAQLELEEVKSYVYCEGPGSVLGLRLCAMAIETWRRLFENSAKLYRYNGMQLIAAQLLKEERIKEDSLLLSDWKKDTWNGLKLSPKGMGEVKPVHVGELKSWQGPLFHLPARKGWQEAPDKAVELPYQPKELASLIQVPGLIVETGKVELYQSGLNTFQKWTPQRHGADASIS